MTLPWLGRLDEFVIDAEGNAQVAADLEVRRQGATIDGDQSVVSGGAITVYDRGAIEQGDTVTIGDTVTTTYLVDSRTATTVTISGFGGTLNVSDNERIRPVNNLRALYLDVRGSEAETNPLVTSATGRATAWLVPGFCDYKITTAGASDVFVDDLWISAPSGVQVVANPYYAKFDGATVDSDALDRAVEDVSDAGGGTVELSAPTATCRVSSPIVLPDNVVLRGGERRASVIEPSDSFSWNGTTDALVQLGEVGAVADVFGARVERLTLNCRGQASSIGIYSDSANEGCGWSDVLINQAALKGVYLKSTASRNLYCQGLEIVLTSNTAIGIHLDGVTEHNTFADVTIRNSGGGGGTARGILVENASWADFIRVRAEDQNIGVEYSSDSRGIVRGLVGDSPATALIKFNGGGQGVYGLNPSGSAHLIWDNSGFTGNTVIIESGALGSYYHIGAGADTGGTGRDLLTDYVGTVAAVTTRATQIQRRVQGRQELNNTLCLMRNPFTGAGTIDGRTQAFRGNHWVLAGATPVQTITADSNDTGRPLLIGTDGTVGGGLVEGGNLDLEGDWLPTSSADNILLIQAGSGYQEVSRRIRTPEPGSVPATQTVALTTAPQTITVNDDTTLLRLTRADGAVAGDIVITITYNSAFDGRPLAVYAENNDLNATEDIIINDSAGMALHGSVGWETAGDGTHRSGLILYGDGVLSRWFEVGRSTLD